MFRDIAKYENLTAYANAVAKALQEGTVYDGHPDNDIPEFIPLQFYIYHGDICIAVSGSGIKASVIEKELEKLEEQVGSRFVEFDSPIMEIEVNTFERELYIKLA